jgi:tRNA 2-thiocytidine biosynthesis protein TtcA
MEAYLKSWSCEYRIVRAPIHETMIEKLSPDDTPCSLCSRIRRGVLYTKAIELGCTKIALGHHREDFIETLLLNQFYNGKIKAMAPLLYADDGRNVVIRPLVYVAEDDIARFASAADFPVTCCACPSCGDPDMKRAGIKKLLAGLEQDQPGIKSSLLAALSDVDRRHLPAKAAKNAVHRVRDDE